jgi:excisionase family DNA binding protein
MAKPGDLMTSAEAARLLGVGVTAIKRWTAEGSLPCVRTPGGHRRFRSADVERLGRGESSPSSNEWEVWIKALRSADVYTTLALLFSERAERKAWFLVADRLGALLRDIGDRWQRGSISVSDEHVLSAAFERALTITVESMAVSHDAPRCLLAAAEGEEHTLGLSLAELCLREAGWRALWTGGHTRSVDIVEQVRKRSVQMVALSASAYSTDRKLLRVQTKRVGAVCQRHDVALVLGGSGGWSDQPAFGHRLNDCAGFARLLHRMDRSRS